MKFQLKAIASIHTGVFRKLGLNGDIIYLQAKNFNNPGELKTITGLATYLKRDSRLEKHILRDRDILLAAKGERNFAYLYHKSIGSAAASSTFFVIRLKRYEPEIILPEYLHWYLNHPHTQALLKFRARGSSLPSVSKKTLEELTIPVPDLNKQKNTIEFNALVEKEKLLTQKILEKKTILYQTLNYKYATNAAK